MPFAKLRQDYTPLPTAPAPEASIEVEEILPVHSPALALQQKLAQRANVANGANLEKWSPRRSVALIVSASLALWVGILMAGAEVAKLVA